MSYSNRIYMYGPVGLLLMIVVLYSVFWRVEADTLSARLDRANGGEIAPGVSFSFAQKTVGGYPFRLDAVLSGVSFGYRNGGTQIGWRTERFALHRMAYGRNQFIFEADGRETLSWTPQPDAMPETVAMTPEAARASAILNAQGRLLRLDVDLWRPQGTDTDGSGGVTEFAADRAQFHALARRNDTLDLVVQVDNSRAGPAGSGQYLPVTLPQIDCRATVSKANLLSGVETGTEDAGRALDKWRDSSGQIDVTSLALNWPDARAVLRGDLTLDEGNHLAGSLRGDRTVNKAGTQPLELTFADGHLSFTPP